MTRCPSQDWDRYSRDQEIAAEGAFMGEVEKELQAANLMGAVVFADDDQTVIKLVGFPGELNISSELVDSLYGEVSANAIVRALVRRLGRFYPDVARRHQKNTPERTSKFYRRLDYHRMKAQMASDDALYKDLTDEH